MKHFVNQNSSVLCKMLVFRIYGARQNFYAFSNGDRMHVKLNGEPLEEVDCFTVVAGDNPRT